MLLFLSVIAYTCLGPEKVKGVKSYKVNYDLLLLFVELCSLYFQTSRCLLPYFSQELPSDFLFWVVSFV